MAGFIEGVDRSQTVLFLDPLEDWIAEDSLVRVVNLFVGEIDLPGLGLARTAPARSGWPGYHPDREDDTAPIKRFSSEHRKVLQNATRLDDSLGRSRCCARSWFQGTYQGT